MLLLDRFDRDENGSRIGYISADSILNRLPNQETTYVDLAEVVGLETSQPKDLEELFRRIALTLLVNNVEDHMRNHGMLRGKHGWYLSPAFDINPFRWVGSVDSTPISDRDDPSDRDIRLLVEEAEVFGMSTERAAHTIGEVERATSNWHEVATSFGIPPKGQWRPPPRSSPRTVNARRRSGDE